MQQKKLKELLSEVGNLVSIAELKPFSLKDIKANTSCRIFGDDPALVFYGYDKVKQLEEAVELFWESNDEVYQTIAKTTVQDKLNHLVSSSCQHKQPLTESHIEQMFSELLAIPKEEWEVFRVLYGARLSTESPLKLGPFTVYNWKLHQSVITTKYECNEEAWWIQKLKDAVNYLLVSVKVSTRDLARGQELADIRFRRFENVVRYMLANKEGSLDVGIFDYRSRNSFSSISLSKLEKIVRFSSHTEGAYEQVDIDAPFFKDSSAGHTWIWDTLSQSSLSKVQKRVISAIEWVGKGLRDPDPAKAFVQFVFAIEATLTFQEKGVLVSPSIANHLAEYSAFIIGNDFESRSKVEKLVKEIYSRRSAVAHGGSQSVLESEVNEALELVKSLITKIITEPELLAMTSIDQLQEWVSRKKYS